MTTDIGYAIVHMATGRGVRVALILKIVTALARMHPVRRDHQRRQAAATS